MMFFSKLSRCLDLLKYVLCSYLCIVLNHPQCAISGFMILAILVPSVPSTKCGFLVLKMAKSAINILQEHCIIQYKKYPDYFTKDVSTGNSPLFSVECAIGNVRTAGIASSKIAAKTQAAEQMVAKLNLGRNNFESLKITTTSNFSQSPDKLAANYVGQLNEYCSQNNYAYPQYLEEMNGSTFVTKCKHQSFVSFGRGSNKKIAKQESAREMLNLIQKPHIESSTTNNYKDYNFVDLGGLSLITANETTNPCKSLNVQEPEPFKIPNHLDHVSGLNVYCDKYKYKKPEYFDCGKEGQVYSTKCIYQSFKTMGKGVTSKFAKQDSARQMLELIGINHPDKQKSEDNLIDISDNDHNQQQNQQILQPQKQPTLEDTADIEIYKKYLSEIDKTETNDVDALASFFGALGSAATDDEGQSSPHLRKILKQNKVKYEIKLLQPHDPCIMVLTGTRLMSDGTVINKHLLEMGDRQHDILGQLLIKAVASFQC